MEAFGEVRALRDQYTDDAHVCFNRHGRPELGCIDYRDSSKRIANIAAREGRLTRDQKAKLAHYAPVYLCDHCPVHHGFVVPEIRHKRGMYK